MSVDELRLDIVQNLTSWQIVHGCYDRMIKGETNDLDIGSLETVIRYAKANHDESPAIIRCASILLYRLKQNQIESD